MVKQYQNMREQFLDELKTILFDFQLNVEVLKAAWYNSEILKTPYKHTVYKAFWM